MEESTLDKGESLSSLYLYMHVHVYTCTVILTITTIIYGNKNVFFSFLVYYFFAMISYVYVLMRDE